MENSNFTRTLSSTDVEYGLISATKSTRRYFPGKGDRFRILFDPCLGDGTTSFGTCLDRSNRIREGQRYISAFYQMHNLREGDMIYFEVIEAEKVYRLSARPPEGLQSNPPEDIRPAARAKRPRQVSYRRTREPVLGITLDQLKATKAAMPEEQFRQIWGQLYDRLVAEERARACTEISEAELGRRARQVLRKIHAFLNGNGDAVSSEMAYDWMRFCYALGLYRETAALFSYVFQNDLCEWAYERARKLAEACRAQIG